MVMIDNSTTERDLRELDANELGAVSGGNPRVAWVVTRIVAKVLIAIGDAIVEGGGKGEKSDYNSGDAPAGGRHDS